MEKYQKMIYQRIEKTLAQWKNTDYINEEELYRFFHNIKGTAGTIGMDDMHDFAEQQLLKLTETSEKNWTQEEWMPLLHPLLPYLKVTPVEIEESKEEEEFEQETPLILIIDDDVEFVTFLKDLLEENGYQALIALNGEKGVELYYEFSPRLVILDYYLPDGDGVEMLEQIIDKAMHDFTPVIMLSAKASQENKIRAYQIGAMDFISKPLQKELFFPFVENRLRTQDRIWQSALQDELTGAKNRKFMVSEMKALGERIRRNELECYTLLLCDLDHFKKVNDTYGHLTGDEALRHFVREIEKVSRPGDVICRYGGEEFVVVLPNASKEHGAKITDRVRHGLNTNAVANTENLFLQFSAGIEEVVSEDVHPESVIEKADKALYAAKKNGRSRTVLYHEDLNTTIEKGIVHIIVVDDDAVVRDMMRHYIERRTDIAGKTIRFHSYADGADFLKADWYKEDDYYFLLLDGMMPKVDGIEVLTNVRSNYEKDRILISMLTARKGEIEIARALEIGADDYMLKPFRVREVMARMERLMERVFN